MKASVMIPRAFHNWALSLGVKTRVKIQAWQYAKHAVLAANFIISSASLDKAISGLERRIVNVVDTGFKALALSLPIMLVEDSAQLLRGIEKHLNKLGFYNIIKHTNPLEAIKDFRSMTEKPRLAITDQSMPELQGTELIKRLVAEGEKTAPRFILFSGSPNLLETDNPASSVLKEHRVLYIQKGVDTDLFTLSVLEAAIEVVRGVAPSAKALLVQGADPTKIDFINNPYYQFAGRIVHKTNNELAKLIILTMALEDGTLAEDKAELLSLEKGISHLTEALAAFTTNNDLASVSNIDESVLPKSLMEDTALQKVWASVAPEQRNNFAIITDQYLQNGLLVFSREITELMEMLYSSPAAPNVGEIMLKHDQAKAILVRLNNAVTQRTPEDPLAQLFANYYRLLENL
ncbi:MAG: response regulator [Candidatus Margulisiibacteriota bacterium]